MPKSAPAFQFYAQDFLVGTMMMSASARGCYISMLCFSWSNGPIPDNKKALSISMCWSESDGPFNTLWAELKPKWSKIGGAWINNRLEHVRNEQDEYRKQQSEKGKKSAKSRLNHGSTAVQPSLNRASTEPQSGSNPSSSPLILDLRTSPSPSTSRSKEHALRKKRVARAHAGFDAFWAAYPNKTGIDRARKAWNKHTPDVKAVHAALKWQRESRRWTDDDGQFVPYASTWINNKSWADEPPSTHKRSGVDYMAWFDECKSIHGGKCESQMKHHNRKTIDAAKVT